VIWRHGGVGLLGAAVALAAVAVHRTTVTGLPLGLLLAAAASLSAGWWLRGSRRPRLAVTYAVGWILVFALALQGRPEGDFVLAADPTGYALMAVSLGVLALGVWGLASRPGRRFGPRAHVG
jgi:hypothetical protein